MIRSVSNSNARARHGGPRSPPPKSGYVRNLLPHQPGVHHTKQRTAVPPHHLAPASSRGRPTSPSAIEKQSVKLPPIKHRVEEKVLTFSFCVLHCIGNKFYFANCRFYIKLKRYYHVLVTLSMMPMFRQQNTYQLIEWLALVGT